MSSFDFSTGVGESQEHIAFRLFELVYSKEKNKGRDVDAQWILDTYAKCLVTVQKPTKPPSGEAMAEAARQVAQRLPR